MTHRPQETRQHFIPEWLKSYSCFIVFCVLIPWLFLCFFVVKVSNLLWFITLSLMYPDLKFVRTTTLRTLVETQRNQGMLSVLLTINGPAKFDNFQKFLELLLEKTDKYGQKRFINLTKSLVNVCGYYAWRQGQFSLDKHLILADNIFRGRPLTEENIQDFVSSIVLKYLAIDVSPWQMVIIPISNNKHYLLLRVHHILLADSEISIADLLPIKHCSIWSSDYSNNSFSVGSTAAVNNKNMSYIPISSPLLNLYEKPKYLTYLYDRFKDTLTNYYNQLILDYDPLENSRLRRKIPGLFEYLGMILVTCLQVYREFYKLNIRSMDSITKINYILKIMDKEIEKRDLCFVSFLKSFFVTFNPINVTLIFLKIIWTVFISLTFRLPLRCLFEMRAFYFCLSSKKCTLSETYVCFIYNYVPIVLKGISEFTNLAKIIFNGPLNILRNCFKNNKPLRQTSTISGRKIVAWSDAIDKELLHSISEHLGVSESVILLEVISASFFQYYRNDRIPVPESIAVMARNIDSSFLFDHYSANNDNYFLNNGYNLKSGGLVLLDLPLKSDLNDNDLLDNMRNLKKSLQYSKENEQFLYLLSILQMKYQFLSSFVPVTILKLISRFLTRKHTVMITEMSSCQSFSQNFTLWNDEVSDVIYWEPPQANISISISINPYTKGIRLAVMCDAQLSPNHTLLVNEFRAHLNYLKRSIGL